MTWKAYAAVSGATVLAGWMASAPPSTAPETAAPARPRTSSRVSPAASDIQQLATRLQARVRRETVYAEPERNPFRFGAARPVPRAGGDALEDSPAVETLPPVPPPLAVSLSGVAEDQVGQRVERTAILSSPEGVLLVHEGDDVLGQYRVAKIESDAVELVKIVDGAPLRLTFRP